MTQTGDTVENDTINTSALTESIQPVIQSHWLHQIAALVDGDVIF